MSQLFSPIAIGGITLPNRVAVPPMCQYMADADGLPNAWHHMHYGSLAISGAGLVIVEATGVEAIGRISPCCLGLYNDEQEAAFRAMLDGISTYAPVKFGIQLGHAGRKASSHPFDTPRPVEVEDGGWLPVAPSAVAHSEQWPLPIELSREWIAKIVGRFVDAVRRADRAGFDVVELHGAHGYLISSFLSPIANERTDEYGGSLQNRMRFAVEIAQAVRDVWPAHKALGIRLNGTDWHEGGITLDETIVVARTLKAVGLEYVSVSSGGNARQQQLPPVEPGYQLPLAAAIREGSGLATMAVGMLLKPQQADEIISDGRADIVAVGRAMLDDPRWPLHAAQALGDEVVYPRSYWRTAAKFWPGYRLVHDLPVEA